MDIHNSVGIKLLTPIRINKLTGNYKFIDKAIIENSDLTLDDYVYIEGNVEFINSNIDSTGLLTNGIISIIGNFSQLNSKYSFLATDNHKVIFCGDIIQTIFFESPVEFCNVCNILTDEAGRKIMSYIADEVFSEEDNYYYSLGQYMISKMISDVLGGSTVAISAEVVAAAAVATSEVIIVVVL